MTSSPTTWRSIRSKSTSSQRSHRTPRRSHVSRSTIAKLREQWQTQTWPAGLRGAIQDDVNQMSEYLKLYKEFPTLAQEAPDVPSRASTR